ncbi:MAG: hypothetical protein ACLFVQ_08975 [Chitinispirillaceae bacterium]
MLRNFFLIMLTTIALTYAGGRNTPSDNGGNGMDGGTPTDTTQIQGTITSLDTMSQMFVIEHETGSDTIYYNDQTMFEPDQDELLQEDNEVMLWYMEQQGDKIAARVEMAGNGDGAMPDTEEDTMPDTGNGMMPDTGNGTMPDTGNGTMPDNGGGY